MPLIRCLLHGLRFRLLPALQPLASLLTRLPHPAASLLQGSSQGHWRFPHHAIEQGYAYILTHPGTPCVFWDHLLVRTRAQAGLVGWWAGLHRLVWASWASLQAAFGVARQPVGCLMHPALLPLPPASPGPLLQGHDWAADCSPQARRHPLPLAGEGGARLRLAAALGTGAAEAPPAACLALYCSLFAAHLLTACWCSGPWLPAQIKILVADRDVYAARIEGNRGKLLMKVRRAAG